MTSDHFAQCLAANRSRFNAKFAEARWRWPRLAPEAFADLLRLGVAPVVEAVAVQQPGKTAEVTEALYDLALDLLGQELLGTQSRYPQLVEGWTVLLPRLARFVAEAPRPVVGAVTNALYNLASTPGARPQAWIAALLQLADVCPDGSTLLQAGQVAAWRAGLAHYRLQALDLCAQLAARDGAVARAALGLPAQTAAPLDFVLEGLRHNPWLSPAAAAQASRFPAPRLKIVARVGAFRGFGGAFLAPPVVLAVEGKFIVCDGASLADGVEGHWLLTADVFGATLHRAPAVAAPPQTAVPEAWKGVVGRRGLPAFRGLQTVTSVAGDETTLAVTTTLSHAVYLLAMVEEGDER